MYTNKAPGGVAYRCSFRVTEAMFFQERMVQAAADDLGIDQAEFRRMNFVRDDDFPHRTPFGFLTDSGQYGKCLDVGLEAIGYDDFLARKEEAAKRGPAARHRHLDHDRAARRGQQPGVRHPRHQDVRLGRAAGPHDRQGDPAHRGQVAGPGPRDDVGADRRARARHPGRGRRWSRRATPTPRRSAWAPTRPAARRSPGAAVAMVSRKIRAKARKLAAHLLEVSEEDLEWELGRFYVRSAPDRGASIQECAMAAYSNMPDGLEPGLEANAYYDPPNLTWPFACYIVTVEVDPETGVWDVLQRRRGRRLRGADQPDDRRGPDHGRPDRGLRHGQHAVHHLRRRGQLHRLELHGLPAADRLGDARVTSCTRS